MSSKTKAFNFLEILQDITGSMRGWKAGDTVKGVERKHICLNNGIAVLETDGSITLERESYDGRVKQFMLNKDEIEAIKGFMKEL